MIGGLLLVCASAVGGLSLIDRLIELQARLGDLESARQEQARGFDTSWKDLEKELSQIRSNLETTFDKADAAVSLSDRLSSAEDRLGDIGQAIEAHSSSLSALEKEREAFGPDTLEQQLAEHDQLIQQRWESFSNVLSVVQQAAEDSRRRVERLDAALETQRDLSRMWHEIVGPVVQLAGETSVGSGVLLRSRESPEESLFVSHLLTAWHVVRDIQGDLSKTDQPVPVTIYLEDGSTRHETALLLRFDPEIDAALLELRTSDRLPDGAALASRERLRSIRIFDAVYAVGCPLGNDPIPTYGEIATVRHSVDGENYWMINAPTYIGNSGGGIFDSRTHELVGIFSKIYTHGAVRPTIVPHMGLVTPLDSIYAWLEREGYAAIVPDAPAEADIEPGIASFSY